ncbi:hypothetical protein LBWT_55230 [Leptolyngbya boryana IAM M-101]|nr:hypothetical protein LBWT_55230 [Leptolyngbya boryana IAM M-101]BAS65899.1 hypothetical protein LBDG_55230 [Leptolyngbya boryana dg5]
MLEIGNVLNGEVSIALNTTAICTVLVKSTQFTPIEQNNYKSGGYLVDMHYLPFPPERR